MDTKQRPAVKGGGAGGTRRLRAVCEGVNTEGRPIANLKFEFAQACRHSHRTRRRTVHVGWDAPRDGEAVRHTRRNRGTGYTGTARRAEGGPVTIRDVASRAGVSPATVSRVFSQPDAVAPETRKKVLVAAEELRYAPNPVARSLARRRTGNLGVVVPDIANSFSAVIIKAVQQEARRDGYALFVAALGRGRRRRGTLGPGPGPAGGRAAARLALGGRRLPAGAGRTRPPRRDQPASRRRSRGADRLDPGDRARRRAPARARPPRPRLPRRDPTATPTTAAPRA